MISAPTGGGKTTLVNKALPILQEKIAISRIVTYTTRAKRQGEEHGKDYQFVTKEQFNLLNEANFFIEVTSYNDNLYGSPNNFSSNLSIGESFVAITDRLGLSFYKDFFPEAVCIWIAPPSLNILATRLTERGSESEKSLKQRLQLAEEEMMAEKTTPLCHHHIINDKLDQAVTSLISIIERITMSAS